MRERAGVVSRVLSRILELNHSSVTVGRLRAMTSVAQCVVGLCLTVSG